MISKGKLKEHIDKFPDSEISKGDLIDRFVFMEKLEQRIYSSQKGEQTLSVEDMKSEIAKWSK